MGRLRVEPEEERANEPVEGIEHGAPALTTGEGSCIKAARPLSGEPAGGATVHGVMLLFAASFVACEPAIAEPPASPPALIRARSPAAPFPASDAFISFLDAPNPVAGGFTPPLDSGWRACGEECWESQGEHPIRAMAAGRVAVGTGGELSLRHSWYENHELRELNMVVSGATPAVANGMEVLGGAPIGHGRRIRLQLRGTQESPSDFVAARRALPVPAAERSLALISHDARELRLYREGTEVGRFQVAFGQEAGQKLRQGDNRTPKGLYYVTQKSTGPFGGPAAAYFGGYWMRVNYPNAFDAARAVDEGWITQEEQRSISRNWRARRETTKRTRLGGGIGLHGWAYEWSDDDSRALSWGCVVMHLYDAPAIYAEVQEGTMVVLF